MPATGRNDERGMFAWALRSRWTGAARPGGVAVLAIAALTGALWLGPPAGAAEAEAAASPQAAAALAKDDGSSAGGRCLSRADQRARSADKTVVPLARAVQSVKTRGELLRARLCEQNGKLVYQITVLPKGGKVVRATVDAGSGALIASH